MYYRQKCPYCKTEKEFVFEQIGHAAHCKHCNQEFKLEKKSFNFTPHLIMLTFLVLAAGVLWYIIKTFHDWWIYR